MIKKIIYGNEAKQALQKGIDAVANCVRVTLGAKGRFVALDKEYTAPLITNDGVTIAKEIKLADEFENMGSKLIYEASAKTNADSGDGTTTAIVLTQSLVSEGLEYALNGTNPILIKKGMEKAVDKVVEYIKQTAISIRGAEDISKIATISSRDTTFGEIISKIIEEVGNDVVITVEDSNTGETTFEIVEGLQFDKGYLAPHMVTNSDKMIAEYDNPYILITDQKITNIQDILPLLEAVAQTGRGLLIISDEISNEALGTLIANKLRGSLNIVCVKPPKFGEMRELWLEDIAIVTGGKYCSSKLGMKIKDIELSDLGTAKKIKVDKDSTTIIDGNGSSEMIEQRINAIKNAIPGLTTEFDREKYKERLAKLTNGVAVIKVGANTEIELNDKKLRLEDALSATRAAIDEGIVAGGGIALLNASIMLDGYINTLNQEEKIGAVIVKNALQYPFVRIVENAGFNSDEMLKKLSEQSSNISNCGFDVYSEEFVDMIAKGIIDPAKVTRTALQNALSVAGMILTTDVLIADDKSINKEYSTN